MRSGSRRLLAVGLFLAVSLGAAEALAVGTALPTIADDLGGRGLYGAVFAANMLATLVAIVAAGQSADRHGPARPFAIAAVVFIAGLVVAGLAPAMWVVVVGRALQGLGIGGFLALNYVVVRRAFPDDEQPRMFALLSAAWVLPALVAPVIAGTVTEVAGWRWVFLGMVPLVVVATAIVAPLLVRLGADPDAAPANGRVRLALLLAFGATLALVGLTSIDRPALAVALVTLGVAVAARPALRLLPAGTLQARPGRPAAVLTRGCSTAAFLGADAFVPLAAERIHGARPLAQGTVIVGASLTWTVGQAVAARRHGRTAPRRLVSTGLVLLAVGLALTVPVVWASWPLWLTFVTWAVGGLGMGLLFNPTSLVAMGSAGPAEAGLASSQINVADSLGFATMGAVGGAVVRTSEVTDLSTASALTVVFGLGVAAALAGLLGARGLPGVVGPEEVLAAPAR